MLVKCPTCGKALDWDPANKWRPFCCERCKLIDLGEWVAERHAIPGEPVADGFLEPPAGDDDRSH